MKYIRVGLNKLKISLSEKEIKRYNIHPHDDSFDKQEMKEVIFGILKEAERECGYTLGREKAIIQIYPSDSHGAEILITKLAGLAKEEQNTVCSSENVSTLESYDRVFRFNSREDLVLAAKAMSGKNVECDVFMSHDGAYYSVIHENSLGGVLSHILLCEFGEELDEIPYDVISERGVLLAKKNGFEYFTS